VGQNSCLSRKFILEVSVMRGGRGTRGVSESSSSVMIRSIPSHISESDIREALALRQYAYKQVKLVKDNRTQSHKGFGFVDFDTVPQAEHFVFNSPYGYAVFDVKGERLELDFSKGAGGTGSMPRGDGDWMCGYCNAHNFSKRSACFVCKVPKDDKAVVVSKFKGSGNGGRPGGGGGSALNPVALASTVTNFSQPAAVLQVSGLDGFTDQDTVRYSFAPYGVVRDVRLIFDNQTGRSTGVAYVELSSVGEAGNAMSTYKRSVASGTPFLIDNSPVTLEYYNPAAVSNVANPMLDYVNWQYQAQAQAAQFPNQVPGLPEGFVFDPALGCYFNAATQYYYDANSQLFYNSATGIYYRFDQATQQYIQVNVDSKGQPIGDVIPVESNPSAPSSISIVCF
jgi:RNA-binding protein 5/10